MTKTNANSTSTNSRRRRRLYEEADDVSGDSDAEIPSTEDGADVASEKNDAHKSDEEIIRMQAADNTIKYYCYWSFSAALIPIPAIDFAAMTAIQVKLISELSDLYDVQFSDGIAKKAVATLFASGSSSGFASLAKFVPGLGYFGLTIPLATLNVGYTYAIGKIFAQHFQSGADLESFNASEKVEQFKSKLAEGKSFARKAKKEFTQKIKDRN